MTGSRWRTTVVGLVVLTAALIAPAAGAQEQQDSFGYIAVVNGASAEPVTVTVSGIEDFAEELEFGAYAAVGFVPGGEYTVTFSGESAETSFELALDTGTAVTVVSGFGQDDASASAYPVEIAPIDADMAAVAAWNAAGDDVSITLGENESALVSPGEGGELRMVDSGELAVDVEGEQRTLELEGGSHTDVFAVNDGEQSGVAIAVIPSMDDLIQTLFPPVEGGVEIPPVEGQAEADARTALEDVGLVAESESAFSDDVAEGLVIDADPEPGFVVAIGTVVTVVVSLGQEEPAPPEPPVLVVVPDVAGQALADAQVALEAAGLTVAAIEEAASDEFAEGVVISTDPAGGSEVDPESAVIITISTGPEAPATVAVPDVVGLSATEAADALAGLGLVSSVEEVSSAEVEAGLVISTNPAAGIEVAPETEVTLTVSLGPEDVMVPDFSGMSVAEATEAAEAVGVVVEFVEDAADPDPDGVVVDQDPEPGAEVPPGSSVVASLSPAVAEPWTFLTVDPNRQMTVTGINFEPGSTTDLRILRSDLFDSAVVDDRGVWVANYDLTGVLTEEETLLVRGTAVGGDSYESRFTVPAAGQTNDEPVEEDEEGFPLWGWLLILLGVALAGWAAWWAMRRGSQPESATTDVGFATSSASEVTGSMQADPYAAPVPRDDAAGTAESAVAATEVDGVEPTQIISAEDTPEPGEVSLGNGEVPGSDSTATESPEGDGDDTDRA